MGWTQSLVNSGLSLDIHKLSGFIRVCGETLSILRK
jgi:hypothetical protein